MTSNEIIVKEAKTWLNTPYAHNQMCKGYGVDCGHLLIGVLVYSGLGKKEDYEVPYYSNEWHLHRAEEMFMKYVNMACDKVKGKPMPGDFMVYQYGRCVSHGGIYLGDNQIIHAYIDQGVIISSLDDIMFFDKKGRPRLRGIYRWKGVK